MSTTHTSPADVTRTLLAAADTDMPAFFAAFTDDCRFRLGNADTVVGRESIQAWAGEALGSVRGLRHVVLEEFADDGAAALRVDVTYTMASGAEFTLPAMIRTRIRDGKVSECQIFQDPTPVQEAS